MIQEYITYLNINLHYSQYTCKAYAADLRQLAIYAKTYNPEIRWSTLTPSIVENWIASMTGKYDAATICRKLSAVKSLYQYFWKHGKIERNCMRYIKAPKKAEKLPDLITPSELKTMLDALEKDPTRGRERRAIITTLYLTGMRFAELRSLKRADVDFANMTITIDGKGRRQRVAPMSTRLREIMLEYDVLSKHDRATFFAHIDGTTYGEEELRGIIRGTMEAYTRAAHAHALRHRFATALAENGTDLATIKQMMGHKQIESTQIYINMATTAKRAHVEKLKTS